MERVGSNMQTAQFKSGAIIASDVFHKKGKEGGREAERWRMEKGKGKHCALNNASGRC
jgi:hypothetical protein